MERINIAYCFDENLMYHCVVSIRSLLESREGDNPHYSIFCVCNKNALFIQEIVEQTVRAIDRESSVKFIVVENKYESAYEVRGITAGTYLRFLLPEILSEVEHVIYLDIDVIIKQSLSGLWSERDVSVMIKGVRTDINLDDKWDEAAGRDYWEELKEWKGNYINAGILLMNLQKIRETGMNKLWDRLSGNQYYYQDQDIINITCQKYIGWLPLKYNVMVYIEENGWKECIRQRIYTEGEVEEARNAPICIHFAGEKPWNNTGVKYAEQWWGHVLDEDRLTSHFKHELLISIKNAFGKVEKQEELRRRNGFNFKLLVDWMKLKQGNEGVSVFLRHKRIESVAIYGMNHIGKLLYNELKNEGLCVRYGIDQNANIRIKGFPIYQMSDELPKVDAIIVTAAYYYDEIEEKLKKKISVPVYSFRDIING